MTTFGTFAVSLFTLIAGARLGGRGQKGKKISSFLLVAGVFGMNLNSGMQESPHVFDEVAIISAVLVVVIFVAFVFALRHFGVINFF